MKLSSLDNIWAHIQICATKTHLNVSNLQLRPFMLPWNLILQVLASAETHSKLENQDQCTWKTLFCSSSFPPRNSQTYFRLLWYDGSPFKSLTKLLASRFVLYRILRTALAMGFDPSPSATLPLFFFIDLRDSTGTSMHILAKQGGGLPRFRAMQHK